MAFAISLYVIAVALVVPDVATGFSPMSVMAPSVVPIRHGTPTNTVRLYGSDGDTDEVLNDGKEFVFLDETAEEAMSDELLEEIEEGAPPPWAVIQQVRNTTHMLFFYQLHHHFCCRRRRRW